MRTTKFLSLAALALTFAACSNEEDALPQQPAEQLTDNMITITAQLAPKTNAGTRAVSEGTNTIIVDWAVNEKLEIISANGYTATANIDNVTGGVATISFCIDAAAKDKDCTIIYPYNAAVTETAGIYTADPITAQDGTLNAGLDVRIGKGHITDDATPTLDVTTQPAAQFAIFKFTVCQANGTTAISTKPLTITADGQTYTITPTTATDVLYAALPAVSSKKVIFDATEDASNKTYTCAKLSTTFDAGYFYQTTLKMREYVLMGEGYNLKWATCNIGANNPEDYGDYYSWGATATQTKYKYFKY